MKSIVYFLSLLLITISCKSDYSKSIVTIYGNVQSKDNHQIEFKHLVDNPITNDYRFYSTTVAGNGDFKIEIPINRLTFGTMIIDDTKYRLCLLPDDVIKIAIKNGEIVFSGKGAARNNFIHAETQKEFWKNYYKEFYNAKMTLEECFEAGLSVVKNCNDFIDQYPQKDKIESEYVNYYKMFSSFAFEQLIITYPEVFASVNNIPLDSLKIPDNYKRVDSFKHLISNERATCEYYLTWLETYLQKQFFKSITAGININENNLLLDSLNGKTKEYMLARKIIDGLEKMEYDSILINQFYQIANNNLAINTLNESLNNYNVKRSLIGKPLHSEFIETLVEDTTNTQLSFGELMKKYKGKVVYLDIWSLRCGPCIGEMPSARELENKLKNYPIELVYITQDPTENNLWQNVFEKSMTKNNHYRMVKHEWGSSEMLQFLDISWVPCHMIFDKNGNLVDFLAPRPDSPEIEDLLIELAKK